jgi:D-glycero-alpha-D-manno-heptose-7-phosphate kinase
MIIVRTPYRMSFFGGGTDYSDWYESFPGSVISTTVNKYSFIVLRKLPKVFDYKYRIRYYEVQETDSIDNISIPVIRECLKFCEIDFGIDITHHGDLPARTGIGSSSSFTVGLLHGLYTLKNQLKTKRQLALDALHIEQKILQQQVGSQDQVAAAFGGFNRINFGGHQNFTVEPLPLDWQTHKTLEESIQVFYTNSTRDSGLMAKKTITALPTKQNELLAMNLLTESAHNLLFSDCKDKLKNLGQMLQQEWKLKKTIMPEVSDARIDDIYDRALKSGALGGKLLGAGGGGFLLFLTPPELKNKVAQDLNLVSVPILFEYLGSQIIYHDNQDQSYE